MHQLRSTIGRLWERLVRSEVGEGVISVAIAVLIIAILGGVMYALFNETLECAGQQATAAVEELGDPDTAAGASGGDC